MTVEPDQTYRAVAIAKRPIGHAHVVGLIVETDGEFGLLRHVAAGKSHLYTREEFKEHLALGRATQLGESIGVSASDVGLVLTGEIPELLRTAGTEIFDEFNEPVATETGHALFIGAKEQMIRLRNAIAAHLTSLIRTSIVDTLAAEALGDETGIDSHTDQELETWTDYALDCGSGGLEHQYQAILTRAWLLHCQLDSTQANNLYEVFLAEELTREQFDSEIDNFERTIRAAVERKLWLHGLSREKQEAGAGGTEGKTAIIDRSGHDHHPRLRVN